MATQLRSGANALQPAFRSRGRQEESRAEVRSATAAAARRRGAATTDHAPGGAVEWSGDGLLVAAGCRPALASGAAERSITSASSPRSCLQALLLPPACRRAVPQPDKTRTLAAGGN